MEAQIEEAVGVLWDYMHMGHRLEKTRWIVGFGCYSEEIALRAAELYHQGYGSRILFTGGLGRNTRQMWQRPEAEHFADVAERAGVPREVMVLETESTNTGENILFTRRILEPMGVRRFIGIHKPFMERRLYGAMGVYWPEAECMITSPQVTFPEYVQLSRDQGISERKVIEILAGDFQRIDVYARRGYQLPQQIPQRCWEAFEKLKALGYTGELVAE